MNSFIFFITLDYNPTQPPSDNWQTGPTCQAASQSNCDAHRWPVTTNLLAEADSCGARAPQAAPLLHSRAAPLIKTPRPVWPRCKFRAVKRSERKKNFLKTKQKKKILETPSEWASGGEAATDDDRRSRSPAEMEMESKYAALRRAAEEAAAVDAHAHNLVADGSAFPFLRCFSEADAADALALAPHTLSFKVHMQFSAPFIRTAPLGRLRRLLPCAARDRDGYDLCASPTLFVRLVRVTVCARLSRLQSFHLQNKKYIHCWVMQIIFAVKIYCCHLKKKWITVFHWIWLLRKPSQQ